MTAIAGGEDGSRMVDRKLDCCTANMLECAVSESMELNFQWLELPRRNYEVSPSQIIIIGARIIRRSRESNKF
jgi:hypothetical protein